MKKKRKKPGPKPYPKGIARDNLVTFRLTNNELQVLRDYCWRYDVSIGSCVRDCLDILGVTGISIGVEN
jgi:hypothetical protein